MTALRRLDAPTGRQAGDHACWTSAGAAEASAAVLASLGAGRRPDEQPLFGPSAGETMST